MSELDDVEPADPDALPDLDDEYLDRVAQRLMFNYDLDDDYAVAGEPFDLYGEMRLESQKHFLHPTVNYANHASTEHLFVRRSPGVAVRDLEALVDLGHDLADDWIDPDEQHYSTDFTFAVVAPTISDDVRAFVADFKDRTLLRYGFNGHYEINLLVAAPDDEDVVASESADVRQAFAVWDPIEKEDPGLLQLLVRRLQV